MPFAPPRASAVARAALTALLYAAALAPLATTATPARAQSPAAAAAAPGRETVDSAAVARIMDEGFNRSQVMEIASYLTDVYGARLTGSPSIRAAAGYATKKLGEWGLANPRLEPWGPFGRGWENVSTTASVIEPSRYPVLAYASAWTPGTAGPVTAPMVMAAMDSEADFAKYRGKLKGKIVMIAEAPEVKALFEPLASRYTEQELEALAGPETPRDSARSESTRRQRAAQRVFEEKRRDFLAAEGAVAVLLPSSRGNGGTVFAQGTGGSRDRKAPAKLPHLTLAAEHYGRIARTLEMGVPVRMQLDVRNRFLDADSMSYNLVAEIPGSDPRLKDEVVMLGAHFDSWHTGTGATDNAAGSAVMLEAVRILQAAGLKPRRTVRIALWTGEEQGLLGSRAYVRQHFADTASGQTKPEHARMSAYFNVDNGTGKIRGVYQQGNAAVGPIFQAWMAPFRSRGMTTLTMRNTTGTDHLSFDRVGLPGFQFIQDEVEYGTRTHHSNMDTFERLQADDMRHNAVVVATFVYLAAMRDEMLPRKGAKIAGTN
ncbi:MAG TPA: M20/M25/M40 family metallo-hydrolase [Gemmatimonadaceae bacterium]|nr:M20/M25/M40 family metallo-hydrolase [Gemmatimonadaceae bacterium]